MHSLLALAASHLASTNKSVPLSLGVLHRQKTIYGIKKALARITADPDSTLEEAEALYMASQALAMQTACLGDASVDEFLSTFGGIGTISALPIMRTSRYLSLPLCASYRFDDRLKDVKPLNVSESFEDLAHVITLAEDSLLRLKPYCTVKPAWASIHGALIYWISSLTLNTGRKTLIGESSPIRLDLQLEQTFQKSDAISRLLISYWLTLEFFFDDPTLFIPRTVFPDTQVTEWVLILCKPLMGNEVLRKLANWPVKVAKALQVLRDGEDPCSRTVLLDIVKLHLNLQ